MHRRRDRVRGVAPRPLPVRRDALAGLIAGCIAPFALSDEVTDTIPQETLGAMIGCYYDAIAKRFEDSYNAQRAAALEGDSADADADADDTDPIE